MNSAYISVLLVEDDESMRLEFEHMVQSNPELSLAGSVASLQDAHALLNGMTPDVVIVDLGLPDGNGVDLIDRLRQEAPDTATMVVTIFADEAHVIRAIEAGAHGYLLKDTSIDEFAKAIKLVHNGGAPLSPQIASHLLRRFVPSPIKKTNKLEPDVLTTREIAILTSISQGFSVLEAARSMNISAHTVASHIKNIYSKLAVHNRTEAINHARHKGFIP